MRGGYTPPVSFRSEGMTPLGPPCSLSRTSSPPILPLLAVACPLTVTLSLLSSWGLFLWHVATLCVITRQLYLSWAFFCLENGRYFVYIYYIYMYSRPESVCKIRVYPAGTYGPRYFGHGCSKIHTHPKSVRLNMIILSYGTHGFFLGGRCTAPKSVALVNFHGVQRWHGPRSTKALFSQRLPPALHVGPILRRM